ncbi:TRAP transporter small permease [Paenibacillus doosanensis]|uniref:TRAP transporter small permease n=1 Tax=Paenibacillus doosanensis TaxID=1229154 RepID=UPI00217F3CC6|nr:TRAP transporter small permease [Paenibacillus doosanensis]MCS7461735.1 TRAP transporter small permease [Paenibacillus doosanensis]
MQQVVKIIDGLNKVVGIILAIMLGVMSLLIIAQVICRFFIHFPLTWSEELSRYLMVYIVFLGASLAMRHNKLISIELLPELLTGMKRKVLLCLVFIVSIVFFVILFKQGIDMLSRVKMQSSASLGISMAFPYAAIPIGAVLLTINTIAALLDQFIPKKEDAH